jgi:hypothetical protein
VPSRNLAFLEQAKRIKSPKRHHRCALKDPELVQVALHKMGAGSGSDMGKSHPPKTQMIGGPRAAMLSSQNHAVHQGGADSSRGGDVGS